MKKSIKAIALGLAVLPCALMLTACGGDEPKDIVNIEGEYAEVQETEYSAIVEQLDEGFNLEEIAKGLKAVITVDAEADLAMGNAKLSFTTESVMKGNPDDGYIDINDLESYSKMSAKAKMEMNDTKMEMEAVAKQYIVNGTQYIDLSGAEDIFTMMDPEGTMPKKYFMDLDLDEVEPVQIPQYDVSTLLSMIPEGDWGEYLKISKSDTETGFKIKIVADKDALNEAVDAFTEELPVDVKFTSDFEVYVVYDNNQLAGIYLDTDCKVTVFMELDSPAYEMLGASVAVDVSLNAQLVSYSGNIDYPSFKGYTDYKVLTETY